MTHNELYAIVEKVPREAWPKAVRYVRMKQEPGWEVTVDKITGFYGDGPGRFEDAHAELLFEASMARWLTKQRATHINTIGGATRINVRWDDRNAPDTGLWDGEWYRRFADVEYIKVLASACLALAARQPAKGAGHEGE